MSYSGQHRVRSVCVYMLIVCVCVCLLHVCVYMLIVRVCVFVVTSSTAKTAARLSTSPMLGFEHFLAHLCSSCEPDSKQSW